jgi:hypothetical protein
MEATEESVRALLKSAAHEIGHGVFEQQAGTILAGLNQCVSLHPLLDSVLGRLTGSANWLPDHDPNSKNLHDRSLSRP